LPRPLGWWPLRSFLELGALPNAVPCARRHARQVASEWGLDKIGDDLELLVSELVTNAVAATRAVEPPSPVQMWLLSDAAFVVVLVCDASPQLPVRVQIDEAAESAGGCCWSR
jgi:anti-sigma regulatory factor (Ser/Thr protein kinase)